MFPTAMEPEVLFRVLPDQIFQGGGVALGDFLDGVPLPKDAFGPHITFVNDEPLNPSPDQPVSRCRARQPVQVGQEAHKGKFAHGDGRTGGEISPSCQTSLPP